jgi:hypothetical protein
MQLFPERERERELRTCAAYQQHDKHESSDQKEIKKKLVFFPREFCLYMFFNVSPSCVSL